MKKSKKKVLFGVVLLLMIIAASISIILMQKKTSSNDSLSSDDISVDEKTQAQTEVNEVIKQEEPTATIGLEQEESITVIEPNQEESMETTDPVIAEKIEKLTELASAIGFEDRETIELLASLPELAEFSESVNGVQEYPTLTYIGHASVKLKTLEGDVIYIDPYYDGDYSEPADYILVTHGHSDHYNLNKCTQAENCKVILWSDALIDGEYKSFELDNLAIEAVPSGDNRNHLLKDNVGFIITINGVSVYHAGDTSMNEGKDVIKEKIIDYAMYPVDGVYNMDSEEATQVADLIGATHNIPIHGYGDEYFEQALEFSPKGKLIVMLGQTIDLKAGE